MRGATVALGKKAARARAELCRLLGSGEFRIGDRLPTVREWAQRLGVSPNTVFRVFAELKDQGVTRATQGGYTYLERLPPAADAPPATLVLHVNDQWDLRKTRLALLRQRFHAQWLPRWPRLQLVERQLELPAHEREAHLIRSLLAGAEPTMAYTTMTSLPWLARQGLVAPLALPPGAPELAALAPELLAAFTLDGRLHGIPSGLSRTFLLYHRPSLAAAGWAAAPATWPEFEACLRDLAAAHGGRPGFHLLGERSLGYWLMHLAYQALPLPAAGPLPPIEWRAAAVSPALEFFHKLLGASLVACHSDLGDAALCRCLAGEMPLLLTSGSLALQVHHAGLGDAFGLAPLPTGPNGQTLSLQDAGGEFINAKADPETRRVATDYLLRQWHWRHSAAGAAEYQRLGVSRSLFSLFKAGLADPFAEAALPAAWGPVLAGLATVARWEPAGADWQKVVLSEALVPALAPGATLSVAALRQLLGLHARQLPAG